MRKTIIKESSKTVLKISAWIIVIITILGAWFRYGAIGNAIFDLIKIGG